MIANLRGYVPWQRMLVVLVFFAAAFVFTDVMSGVCMWRMPKGPGWQNNPPANVTNPPLPDIGFDLLKYNDNSQLPTNILLAFIAATLVYAIMGVPRPGIVVCRFFYIDGVLLIFRSFTIVITSLNNPDPRCNNCGSTCPNTLWGCIVMTLEKFPFFSCGDLMFSGHTVHFFLCALVWQTYYTGYFQTGVKLVMWVFALIGTSTLISCRYHYSVDCIIAGGLTLLAWGYYHYQASQRLKPATTWVPHNFIQRSIAWVEAFVFLEGVKF